MGTVKSCCKKSIDEKLLVTKLDLSHCGCLEVPPIIFRAERYIENLILSSNQICNLPPQLFHCQVYICFLFSFFIFIYIIFNFINDEFSLLLGNETFKSK